MTLADLIGQDHVVKALNRATERDEVSHTYLFEGPPNVGKTTAALALGHLLLCSSTGPRPCGECQSCTLNAAGGHPDLRSFRPVISASPPDKPELWLEAPDHLVNSLIPIDRIRELQDQAALRPFLGNRKVVLIEEADRMTEDAQNCALKTLEEPPGSTVLILTAVNSEALLPTILSRCQRLPFRSVPAATIREWLCRWDELSERAELLGRLAAGRPGLALRLGQSETLFAARREVADLVLSALTAEPIDAMRLAERAEQLSEALWPDDERVPTFASLKGTNRRRAQRSKTCEVVQSMTSWFRDVLLVTVGADLDRLANLDDAAWIEEHGRQREAAWVRHALTALTQGRRQLLQNANVRLTLDAMFTSIIACHPMN